MASSSSKSLAVKYRPATLQEVIAQDEITEILISQLKNKTFRNTVLFTGSAGTGKTTSARAFANALNNGKGTPIEIDAASNNGVDNIRDIINKARQKSLDSEYKVFIFDEVHMLTNQSWNALLKIIEEPPANTVFIFCTTDPQKIPATILSRVQRFDFRRIPFDKIVKRLEYIVACEDNEKARVELTESQFSEYESFDTDYYYTVDKAALEYIAKLSDGGMRDAITMLDKVMSYSPKITIDSVIAALGSVNYDVFFRLTNAIVDYEESVVIDIVESHFRAGHDLKQFVKQYTLFLLDVCKYSIFKNYEYIQIPTVFENSLNDLVTGVDRQFLKELLSEINKLNSEIKWETSVKGIVELRLLTLTQPSE